MWYATGQATGVALNFLFVYPYIYTFIYIDQTGLKCSWESEVYSKFQNAQYHTANSNEIPSKQTLQEVILTQGTEILSIRPK